MRGQGLEGMQPADRHLMYLTAVPLDVRGSSSFVGQYFQVFGDVYLKYPTMFYLRMLFIICHRYLDINKRKAVELHKILQTGSYRPPKCSLQIARVALVSAFRFDKYVNPCR